MSAEDLPADKGENEISLAFFGYSKSRDMYIDQQYSRVRFTSDHKESGKVIEVCPEDKINIVTYRDKQITFKYYDYLTSSNKALKNKGHAYQVSPYRLACCNDFYYLIGFSEKHKKVTAFRVDRIYGIPTVTEMDNLPEPEGFYADDYIKESIHMKRDEIKEIILEFDVSVIDAITDRFGEDLNVSFVNKSDCRATVTTPINNIFFAWIFGFEGKVQIKGPSNIRDRYIRMVSKEMARL